MRRKKYPNEWQEGEILHLYKGKGERGKCSNEREITLSSNMGIINNRIQNVVKFTEFQAELTKWEKLENS